jgi:hypothetical protein
MLKLSFLFDSILFIFLKILTEWVINCVIFQFQTMFNTICRTGAADPEPSLAPTK